MSLRCYDVETGASTHHPLGLILPTSNSIWQTTIVLLASINIMFRSEQQEQEQEQQTFPVSNEA